MWQIKIQQNASVGRGIYNHPWQLQESNHHIYSFVHNINSFHLQNPVVLTPCRAQETASQTLGGKNYIWNCWLNSSSIMIRYKSVVADSRHCYERVSLIWKTNQSSCFRQCGPFPSITCGGAKLLFSSRLDDLGANLSNSHSSAVLSSTLKNGLYCKVQYKVRS